jgi:hypothetical protein
VRGFAPHRYFLDGKGVTYFQGLRALLSALRYIEGVSAR